MVERGIRIESQASIKKMSLEESFAGRDLNTQQLDAIGILDSLPLNLNQKRDMFFYFLWQETGSLASLKEFGDVRENFVPMLDSVMENDEMILVYDEFIRQFSQKGKMGEKIVKLLNEGLNLGEALGELEIKIKIEDEGNNAQERFSDFVRKVELIESSQISDKEIAIVLRASEGRVKRARGRLRREGRAENRTPKEISSVRTRKTFYLRNDIKRLLESGLFNEEIASRTGVTIAAVKHQREILRLSGKIKYTSRAEKKEALRNAIRKYMQEDSSEVINLSLLHRNNEFSWSMPTTQSLFKEIQNEEDVPIVKFNPPDKGA